MKKISIVVPVAPNRNLEVLEEFNQNNDEIEFIVEEGVNPSENRNRGIKKAKTELVAFLNAHSILTDNWIDEVKKFFKDHPEIDIVGGPQLTLKDDPLFER